MKYALLFILLILGFSGFSQQAFMHGLIDIMVSNAKEEPVTATVEIIGLPLCKFKLNRSEYIYNSYILEKADFPAKQDTQYYIQVSAPGYITEKIPLAWAAIQVCLFKPGEKYVYEGFYKVPVFYDNRYLACIIQNGDSSKLVKFCNTHDLKIVSRYNYCGEGFKVRSKPSKEKPNTFIVKRIDNKPFNTSDTTLKAFRKLMPNSAGTFYSRYRNMAIEGNAANTILIYYTNQVEIYIPNKTANDKLEKYLKSKPGVTYKYFAENKLGNYNIIIASLPDSWNIDKVNSFINGAMATGISGAQSTGITGLECPTN
jgi:hypothetical protein